MHVPRSTPLLAWLTNPGWPGHLIALLAGILSTLSFTPFGLWPLGLVSVALFYLGLQQLTPQQAVWRGWAWGLGLFASGASWVYVSIHVHGYAHPLLAGLLTAGFVTGLGLVFALMAWVWARWLRPGQMGWLSLWAFSALWVAQEFFRGWFLTGFPWLYHGYAHTDTWLAGWAPVGSVWLLSLFSVFTACLLTRLWAWRQQPGQLGLTAGLIATIWLGGLGLSQVQWTQPHSEPLSVALIQADVPQSQKWDPDYIDNSLARYRDMSYAVAGVDLIIWSETAIPVLQSRAEPFVQSVADNLRAEGSQLITGIPADEYRDGRLHIYNAITVAGVEGQTYNKHKLVPFGEFVPLEDWLRGLIAFFDLPMSSFSRGTADQPPLLAAGQRLAPYICYEVVYPHFAARLAAESDLLITISNDSWFGRSLGPLQHLQMARMRALESGRWMLRGTNNGVTALIDPRGQIAQQIPQFEQASLVGEVQPYQGLTPWLRWRSWPLAAVISGIVLLSLILRRRLA